MGKSISLYCDSKSIEEVYGLSDQLPDVTIERLDFENVGEMHDDCAVISVSYEDVIGGPRGYMAEFFRRNTGVRHWILVITGVYGAYGATISKWKQLAMEITVPMEILAEHTFGDSIQSLQNILQKNTGKCVVGYMRNQETAEKLVWVLSQEIPEWEFEAVPGEQLSEALKKAGKLILFGQNPKDFRFPKTEVHANKDLILVYHCPGYIYEEYYKQQCRISIEVLRKEGWEISDAFSSVVLCNLEYEQMKMEYRNAEASGNSGFRKDDVFWDTYGFPYRAGEMKEQERTLFWNQFQAMRQIAGRLGVQEG